MKSQKLAMFVVTIWYEHSIYVDNEDNVRLHGPISTLIVSN